MSDPDQSPQRIRVGKNSAPTDFRTRRLLVCLLLSLGETEKQIAKTLDCGIRTVEMEKHRVAKALEIRTQLVVMWAVENRDAIIEAIQDEGPLPQDVIQIMKRVLA